MSADTRGGSRTFVRSLNILLKISLVYTSLAMCVPLPNLKTTWKELRAALDESGGSGLLLGASGIRSCSTVCPWVRLPVKKASLNC